MKTVMLVCSAGMSTSLLVNMIRSIVEQRELGLKIIAASEAEAKSYPGQIDVLLLGPQVKYLFQKMEMLMAAAGTKVGVIDSISYGTLNGEAVLNQILDLLQRG